VVRRRAALERVLLLRTFPAFAELAPRQLAALAELAEDRFYRAGAVLFAEGQPVRHVLYILSGEVELRRGHEVRILGTRSVIGGLAALAQTSDSYRVVAKTDVTAFSIGHEDQIDVFEDDFDMLAGVMRGIAHEYLEERKASGADAGFRSAEDPGVMPRSPLGLVEKLAILRRTQPYNEARLEAVAEVARESPERRFAAGEELWKVGDESGVSLVIAAGVIEGVTADGLQRFRFSRGSIVGGLDSLAAQPRWFDAVAATEVAAIEVHYSFLLDILEDHTEMAMDVLRVLSRGVLALRERNAAAREA
jgi:CRP-like cAMP-binding protein